MLTKTRSDFWKCNCAPMAINVAYNLTRCICCGLHRNDERKYQSRPATNVEVLAAWLLASDERRREIEIASRPTKAGRYVAYSMIHPFQKGTIAKEPARTFFIEGEEGLFYEMNNATCRMDENLYGWLWEPIE